MSAPIAIGVIAATMLLGVPVLGASAGLEARHRASSAADSAALAGADALVGLLNADPCEAAEEVTRAYEATLASCNMGESDVFVTVKVASIFGSATGRARAGVEEVAHATS